MRGPATIVKACADGQRAAEAICHQLGLVFRRPGGALPGAQSLSGDDLLAVMRVRARRKAQHKPPLLPPGERDGFDLVEQTLSEETARAEAERCMQCSQLCDKCVEVCPNRANYTYFVSPVEMTVPILACQDGELRIVAREPFHISQTRQILHVDDFCNDCGNCTTFCVHNGHPFADKPRLFLNKADFQREEDNAFYIQRADRGWMIRRRADGDESWLSLRDGNRVTEFENARLSLEVGADSDVEAMTLKRSFEGVFSLQHVAEMVVVLGGVLRTLPFVLVGQE